MLKTMKIQHEYATILIKPKRSLSIQLINGFKGLLDKYSTEDWVSGDTVINELKTKLKGTDSVGFKVRVYRSRLDITQEKLSKKSKISQEDISKIENNKLTPGLHMAKKLAVALECDYHEFL